MRKPLSIYVLAVGVPVLLWSAPVLAGPFRHAQHPCLTRRRAFRHYQGQRLTNPPSRAGHGASNWPRWPPSGGQQGLRPPSTTPSRRWSARGGCWSGSTTPFFWRGCRPIPIPRWTRCRPSRRQKTGRPYRRHLPQSPNCSPGWKALYDRRAQPEAGRRGVAGAGRFTTASSSMPAPICRIKTRRGCSRSTSRTPVWKPPSSRSWWQAPKPGLWW